VRCVWLTAAAAVLLSECGVVETDKLEGEKVPSTTALALRSVAHSAWCRTVRPPTLHCPSYRVNITDDAAVRIWHARADFGVALLLCVRRFQVKKFWIVAFVFLGTIYANMKTLQYANVETFIVFRSSKSPRERVARGLRGPTWVVQCDVSGIGQV